MQIGRKDLLWNYAATSMRILSGIIVLPITLRMLPSEEMGIWSIFLSLVTITSLLDFGFSNSFSRNITYVYSGVKELKTKGYAVAETSDIDYSLLKSLLSAMKRYYGIVALAFLIIFLVESPFYMFSILEQYSGDRQPVWIAWFIFGGALTYELYTYYYNAILTGRGLVKQNMQIIVLSQSIRIVVTLAFLFAGMGIISLVLGLFISDVISRTLAHRVFYDRETKDKLIDSSADSSWNTIKTLAPNSLKIGLVVLGLFLISQSIILIAPFYLSLSEIAEYGISKQLVALIISLSAIWFNTFYPQLSQYRVREQYGDVKRLYIKSKLYAFLTVIFCGSALLLFGNDILILIKSKTALLNNHYLAIMVFFAILNANQTIAMNTILSSNEIPFYKAALASGIITVCILVVMLKFTSLGVLSLILAPELTLCAYLYWKCNVIASNNINLKTSDYFLVIKMLLKNTQQLFSNKK